MLSSLSRGRIAEGLDRPEVDHGALDHALCALEARRPRIDELDPALGEPADQLLDPLHEEGDDPVSGGGTRSGSSLRTISEPLPALKAIGSIPSAESWSRPRTSR